MGTDAPPDAPQAAEPPDAAPRTPRQTSGWRALAVLLAIAVLAVLGYLFDLGAQLERLRGWVEALGPWGPFGFVLVYVLVTLLALPGSLVTMAAGAIFGLVEGTLYSFAGALVGSLGAFLIARYAARGWVAARVAQSRRFRILEGSLRRHGLKIMTLMRLSPVFPFNFLNFALGLTPVRLRDYTLAGFAMLPGTLLYVYYGYAAGSVARIASGEAAVEKNWAYYVVLGLGLAATVAVTALITRAARRAFREEAALDPAAVPGTEETP